MKKHISVLIAVVLVSQLYNHIGAQTIAFGSFKNLKQQSSSFSPKNVPEIVQKKFQKEFPGVTAEIWEKTDNGYVAEFTSDMVWHRIFLGKRGGVKCQISYYDKTKLPADVRERVKSVYYNYSISSVQEINSNKMKVYLITIEDKNSWKIIRVIEDADTSDGDMDVYAEYVKG